MKKFIGISILILAIIVLGYYLQTFNFNKKNNIADASRSKINQNIITIADFAFSPATITITKNTSITWINNDIAPHQIKGNKFSSKILKKGNRAKFKFIKAGTYNYICKPHPFMKGKIIVK